MSEENKNEKIKDINERYRPTKLKAFAVISLYTILAFVGLFIKYTNKDSFVIRNVALITVMFIMLAAMRFCKEITDNKLLQTIIPFGMLAVIALMAYVAGYFGYDLIGGK